MSSWKPGRVVSRKRLPTGTMPLVAVAYDNHTSVLDGWDKLDSPENNADDEKPLGISLQSRTVRSLPRRVASATIRRPPPLLCTLDGGDGSRDYEPLLARSRMGTGHSDVGGSLSMFGTGDGKPIHVLSKWKHIQSKLRDGSLSVALTFMVRAVWSRSCCALFPVCGLFVWLPCVVLLELLA